MNSARSGFERVGDTLHFLMPPHLEMITARLYLRGSILNGAKGSPAIIAKRLEAELGARPLVAPMQVHGTAVVLAAPIVALPQRPRADAVLIHANRPIWGSLRFADCTPVLVAGGTENPWALGIHSGFRGTLRQVVPQTLSKVSALTGGQKVDERTHAWIGPAIGPCCYGRKQADPSTAEALLIFPDDCWQARGEHVYFDLHRAIARQLEKAGIPTKNIHSYPHCTSCHSELYYSWRKGDSEDRMFLLFGRSPLFDGQAG